MPAEVDAATGYRRYHRDQARQIRMLRWDGLPVEEIRQVIDDPAGARDVLTRHRRRLERQRGLLTAQIRDAECFVDEGVAMPAPPGRMLTGPDQARRR